MRNAALVIIDMQTALVNGAFREREILERIHDLAAKVRSANIPVIYIQHNHASFRPMMKGEPGWRIHPAVAPQPEDLVLEKEASDAFYGTRLAKLLRELGVKTVMLAGMQTEYCVDATARSALSHEFDVLLLSDCHTTGDSTLTAQQIIDHHNALLPMVVHPCATLRAVASTEVSLR